MAAGSAQGVPHFLDTSIHLHFSSQWLSKWASCLEYTVLEERWKAKLPCLSRWCLTLRVQKFSADTSLCSVSSTWNSEVTSTPSISIYALVQTTVDHKGILNWGSALASLTLCRRPQAEKKFCNYSLCCWITYFPWDELLRKWYI